eukprot:753249-Hanusia_phi.AAC.2
MPSPMDYMAHELQQPGSGKEIFALKDMLEAAEKEEKERENQKRKKLVCADRERRLGDVDFIPGWRDLRRATNLSKLTCCPEEPYLICLVQKDDKQDIDDWLSEISKKDSQLRKEKQVTKTAESLPPVRNSNKQKKIIQSGPSEVEKQKGGQPGRGEEKAEKMKKNQKYYSYDYFREWDKFDVCHRTSHVHESDRLSCQVDQELKRIEEEEKQQQDFKNFKKKAADVSDPSEVHDANISYKVDSMTKLERSTDLLVSECAC